MRSNPSPIVPLILLGCCLSGLAAFADNIRCVVKNRTVNTIYPRLFGHFMERPSWGEGGPQGALVPGTDQLHPAVVDRLREMKISLVRFPGATDADFLD